MKSIRRRPPGRADRMRGSGLMELLIGTFVGLFVLGGAGSLSLQQSRTHRAHHLQLRLQDEVRTTLRVIEREIRRAGTGLNESEALTPGRAVHWDEAQSSLVLRHRVAGAESEVRALRWRDGQLELRVDDGGYQPLTDRSLLQVNPWSVVIEEQTQPLDGAALPSDCRPARLMRRQLTLQLRFALRSAPERVEERQLELPLPPTLLPVECP